MIDAFFCLGQYLKFNYSGANESHKTFIFVEKESASLQFITTKNVKHN